MVTDVEHLSLELAAELADGDAADRAAVPVDPREIPTRFSLLRKMAQSPAHYYEAAQHPQDDSLASRLGSISGVRDRSEALRIGTAVHFTLLGQPHKVARYCGRRQGNAWVNFQKAAIEEGASEILNEREHALATMIAGAILRHREAMRLLFDGTVVEQRIDWTWLGKAVRSTPDAYKRGSHLVDLKTTVSAAVETFKRHALRLFYHAQAALYGQALEGTFGDSFIIAVEKTPPYPVTIFRFTDAALELGLRFCRLWMEQLNVCEASGVWPAYASDVVDFDIDDEHGVELSFDGRTFRYGA